MLRRRDLTAYDFDLVWADARALRQGCAEFLVGPASFGSSQQIHLERSVGQKTDELTAAGFRRDFHFHRTAPRAARPRFTSSRATQGSF